MNSLLILGCLLFVAFLCECCYRVEMWLRIVRDIHRLFKRVQGWERRNG